jgi:CheY-like chemotaxis protein
MLARIGFDVTESENGRHALSVLREKPCLDLLVTETQAPEVDGRTLAEAFMLECPPGRSILLSDHVDTAEINIESTGAWIFVPKQGVAELLVEAVRKIGLAHPHRVILLAEDEPLVRNLLQSLLTKAGYAVISAADGQEALEISRAYTDHMDLVLSDVQMPRMTGWELANRLKHERPTTRILLMSGHADGPLREYLTIRNFLEKPFTPVKLIEKIAELLNEPEVPKTREPF